MAMHFYRCVHCSRMECDADGQTCVECIANGVSPFNHVTITVGEDDTPEYLHAVLHSGPGHKSGRFSLPVPLLAATPQHVSIKAVNAPKAAVPAVFTGRKTGYDINRNVLVEALKVVRNCIDWEDTGCPKTFCDVSIELQRLIDGGT